MSLKIDFKPPETRCGAIFHYQAIAPKIKKSSSESISGAWRTSDAPGLDFPVTDCEDLPEVRQDFLPYIGHEGEVVFGYRSKDVSSAVQDVSMTGGFTW
ncbi:hypothetical protein AW759_004766 [Escherichia coli]|nr:hypothetical protein [Escherichia coli]